MKTEVSDRLLSLTGKRWELPHDAHARSAPEIVLRLLAERGIDPDAPPTLLSPSMFPDMERAVARIERAIATNEKIGIFGDYDCDGITGVAQLLRFFRRHGVNNAFVRLPHRVRDGYGLSRGIVEELSAAGVRLLITVDTGITATEEIACLKERGIDTIITDHHHLREELPPAYAIVHPGFGSAPLPHPSGAGVVYKLIHALEKAPWPGMEEDTALAMMGTVADLVELAGENRSLVLLGLRALQSVPSGPIAELRERCRTRDAPLTASDVAFRIAPRINAAGRMSEPGIALEALLHGGEHLLELDRLNDERQELSRTLFDRALTDLRTEPASPLLACVNEVFPHGIIGLIAGKLTEMHGKPSLVAHTDGTTCTASLRSTAHYNITEGLARCGDLLERFGGHAQAAGCTFAQKNFDALRERLAADIREHVREDALVPTLRADAVLDPRDATQHFCEHIARMEPFGQGNPEPLFLLRGVTLERLRPCGGDGSHLQARISGIKSIGFGMAKFVLECPAFAKATAGRPVRTAWPGGQKFDVLVRVGNDAWNGKSEPQFFIEDLRPAA